MLTNVSSITGWSPDKQQTKLGKDEEQQDVGIDPAKGSFDLVIIPKDKRWQKKQVIKKQLPAMEAASVASESAANYHNPKQKQVMNNLTYWSSLSVKAAMAVITSDKKSGSDQEKMAQIAANAVLEAGREYDTDKSGNREKRKKKVLQVDLKDVATKVSVAILEADGDHTVATAVAVVIMNENAPHTPPSKDQGSDSSVSTEVAVNTSDGVQGSTENINEALSSSITTKDTNASIFSRNRWNSRKSKSAADDSIRAAAARGVKKADQGRCDSEWQLQVDRENSELGGGFDRQSVTASMASKRRELEAKEAEIISRNQALEAAALLNQQKEAEIQQRLQELNTTKQKQQQVKVQEDEIKLKNEQLEAAARLNEQLEIEIKQRMLALDEATNALLVRAENVQNEIDTRVAPSPHNGQQAAVSSLGRVDEGNEFVEEDYQQQQQYEYDPIQSNGYDQPQGGTKADGEISVYTNQADYGQQSRFALVQQEDHQEKQQRHERSQSDPSRLPGKGILEQISDKLYSIIDDANLCDTSCADPSTLRPGENNSTQRRPSYHMDHASSFSSSLPMDKPTISGLTTQEDNQRIWSKWFGKSNMAKTRQDSSHLSPVHAALNQALNQPHKMQQTNPNQQLPEYKSPSQMLDINNALAQAMNQRGHINNTQPKALNEALNKAMDQAPGFQFQPISHIQQESSMLSGNTSKVGLSTKLKSRFKKQKNTANIQPQEGSKKRFFSLARRKAK